MGDYQRLNLLIIPEHEWRSQDFGEEWNNLVANSSFPNIFSTWDWATIWWSQYGTGAKSYIVAFYDNNKKLVGIAPLYFLNSKLYGCLPYKTIRFIGDHSVGSEYLGIISSPGLEMAIAKTLMNHLSTIHYKADVYRFNGLRDEKATSDALIDVASEFRGRCRLASEVCSCIRLSSSYSEYLQRLSREFKRNILKRQRRIQRELNTKLVITEHKDQIGYHLEQLFELHTDRWTKRGLPGSFINSKKRAFYYNITQHFLARGWLLFFHLELDGAIRACQYGFKYGDTYYALQTGFDSNFENRYRSIGVVLTAMSIEYCINEGLRAYDFLGGEEDYKTRWDTTPHFVKTLNFYLPTVYSSFIWRSEVESLRLKRSIKKKVFGNDWDFELVRTRLFWKIRKEIPHLINQLKK